MMVRSNSLCIEGFSSDSGISTYREFFPKVPAVNSREKRTFRIREFSTQSEAIRFAGVSINNLDKLNPQRLDSQADGLLLYNALYYGAGLEISIFKY